MESPESRTEQTPKNEYAWPLTDFSTERELGLMFSALTKTRSIEERANLEPVNWPTVI